MVVRRRQDDSSLKVNSAVMLLQICTHTLLACQYSRHIQLRSPPKECALAIRYIEARNHWQQAPAARVQLSQCTSSCLMTCLRRYCLVGAIAM